MEDNRREIKQVRDEYGAGLERKLSIEARDRDQNYQWETKLAEGRQKAISRNAEILIKSELQKGENAKAVFDSLAKFSTTIAETVTEYKKQKDEADKVQGAYLVASGQISQEELRNHLTAKSLLKTSGEATNQIVGGLQQRNANPYLVSNLAIRLSM
jgi:leucyl-tRNA synthetase